MSEGLGLKRVLGLGDLVAIEVGTTIGAGIFVFTGLATKEAGPCLPLCFVAAALPIVLVMLTLAMMGSALPTVGGTYRYPSRLFSPAWAFIGVWGFAVGGAFGAIPLYGLSCAEYITSVLPWFPQIDEVSRELWLKGIAVSLLTIFFLFNLFGIVIAAVAQAVMVVILIGALIFFGLAGLPHVDLANFHPLFPNGAAGFLVGSCILIFCLLGSNSVIELGGEIKRPERDIPLSLMISIPLVLVIYMLVGFVSVGVMPWQPDRAPLLLEPAQRFMSPWAKNLFILAGAFLAITTTLNGTFMWCTKSLMIVAHDGLIPRSLARTSRYGTPHIFLAGIWALGSLTILLDVPAGTFEMYANLGGVIIFVPVMLSAIMLPRRLPQAYQAAAFRLKGIWLYVCPLGGCLLSVLIIIMLLTQLKPLPLVFFIAWLAAGGLFFFVQKRRIKLARGMSLEQWMAQELQVLAGR